MKPENIFLSTIAQDAEQTAGQYGFGLEIAEYCTAWNMDREYPETDGAVRNKLRAVSRSLLHAPFNELFPCAIDPRARQLAADRYHQAIELAKGYGSRKVVIHGGYNPWIYYPVWYVEQSVVFWKEFLEQDPGVEIVLENVLETQPQWLLDVVKAVDSPSLRLCLDVGHVNAYSPDPVQKWVEEWAPYLSHFHIHNNDGTADRHSALTEGTVPMTELLRQIDSLCPDATVTLELMQTEASAQWLCQMIG